MRLQRLRYLIRKKIAFWAAAKFCFGFWGGVREGDRIQISYQRTQGPGILVNGTRYGTAP